MRVELRFPGDFFGDGLARAGGPIEIFPRPAEVKESEAGIFGPEAEKFFHLVGVDDRG